MLSVRKGLVAESGRMRKAAMQRFGEKQAGRQGEQQVRGEGRLGPRSEGRHSGVSGKGFYFTATSGEWSQGQKPFSRI